MTATPPPPGWYADPREPSRARWWDGVMWTERTVRRDDLPPSDPPPTGPALSTTPPPETVASTYAAPPMSFPPLPPGSLPGWYAHPSQPSRRRYWDGTRWDMPVNEVLKEGQVNGVVNGQLTFANRSFNPLSPP